MISVVASKHTTPLSVRIKTKTRDRLAELADEWGIPLGATARAAIEAGLESPHLKDRLTQATEPVPSQPLLKPSVVSLPSDVANSVRRLGDESGEGVAATCRRLLQTGLKRAEQECLRPPQPLIHSQPRLFLRLPVRWVTRIDGIAKQTETSRSAVLRALITHALQHPPKQSDWLPDARQGENLRVSVSLPPDTFEELRRQAGARPVTTDARRLVASALHMDSAMLGRLLAPPDSRRLMMSVRFSVDDLQQVRKISAEGETSDTGVIAWLLTLGVEAADLRRI